MSPVLPGRQTYAEIDRNAITHNVQYFRNLLAPETQLMAVVKADAYGHGAVHVAKVALESGATWLGVAIAEEGVELRNNGITAPILIFGTSTREQIGMAGEFDLDLVVFDREHVSHVVEVARALGRPLTVHLKVDTGMGRVGLQWHDLNGDWLSLLTQPEIHWRGLMSHFAEADNPEGEWTRVQMTRFLDVIEWIRIHHGTLPPLLHIANTAATLRYPGTHFTMVRIGLGIYGLRKTPEPDGLRPVLTLRSRVVFVKRVPKGYYVGYGRTFQTPRESWLATVPIGYADGYRRGLSNKVDVIIRGSRYPVVGRISMDQIVVALPIDDEVSVGDVVTLIGRDGSEVVSANELAETLDTISYEIMTGLSKRVPRVDS